MNIQDALETLDSLAHLADLYHEMDYNTSNSGQDKTYAKIRAAQAEIAERAASLREAIETRSITYS